MDGATVSYFIYGLPVRLKAEDGWESFVVSLCPSNHSFLEVVSQKDFRIAHFVNLFHLRSVRPKGGAKVLLRFVDHSKDTKLLFPSPAKAATFVERLRELLGYLPRVPFSEYSLKNMIRYVLYYTQLATIDGSYTKESIRTMLRRMHIFYDEATIKKITGQSVKDGASVSAFDFRRVFKILFLKEEFAPAFREVLKISPDTKIEKGSVTVEYFFEDFVRKNGGNLKLETVKAFFEQCEQVSPFLPNKAPTNRVDFEAFTSFLLSPLNGANSPLPATPLHGRLCDYVIGSAIRPEIEGPLQEGKVKLNGILRALENNCRFLELCCFDGPQGEPMLAYSAKIRSKVTMREVLTFLADVAFEFSEAPLILSFQTNCSKAQRDVLGKTILAAFGERLFLLTKEALYNTQSPSLSTLQGKVLVKSASKYPLDFHEDNQPTIKQVYAETLDDLDHVTSLFNERKTHSSLKTVYGVHTLTPQQAAEAQADTFKQETMVDFHKRHLCVASVGDSKEGSLMSLWNLGVQFAGVNTNQADEAAFLHHVIFRRHGNNGLIPKPDILTNQPVSAKIGRDERTFNLWVVSGQILHEGWNRHREQLFPYVRVRYLGTRHDMANNPPTHTCIDEFNPFHCTFEVPGQDKPRLFALTRPELGVIIFEVVNAKNDQLIKRGLVEPRSMLEGLHSVALFDPSNHCDSFSALVIKVEDTS